MILYLDTSALVKAYVQENFSEQVLSLIKKSKITASHSIAYVEAHSAFSRLKREEKITEEQYELLKNDFQKDWKNYLHIENNIVLLEHAADLADVLGLRAYDSIHVATADLLAKQTKEPVTFACFDRQLNKAAHILGLILPELSV